MRTESIPISQVAHWTYCPRKLQIIAGEAGWLDNWHTTRGILDHARSHQAVRERRRGARGGGGLAVGGAVCASGGGSVLVFPPKGEPPLPVEFKRTKRPDEVAATQLTLIILCLEEMLGIDIPVAGVFSTTRRRRAAIAIDESARAVALERLDQVRAWLDRPVLIPPRADRRCNGCSLEQNCQPFAPSHYQGSAVR